MTKDLHHQLHRSPTVWSVEVLNEVAVICDIWLSITSNGFIVTDDILMSTSHTYPWKFQPPVSETSTEVKYSCINHSPYQVVGNSPVKSDTSLCQTVKLMCHNVQLSDTINEYTNRYFSDDCAACGGSSFTLKINEQWPNWQKPVIQMRLHDNSHLVCDWMTGSSIQNYFNPFASRAVTWH